MKKLTDYIITDFDDQDLYKFSIQQFYWYHNLQNIEVEFAFFNRGSIVFPKEFAEQLRYQVDHMKDVLPIEEILNNLAKYPFIKSDYIYTYLKAFRYNPKDVIIKGNADKIIIRGSIGMITFWETQLMAIMSELYNFMMGNQKTYEDNIDIINQNDINKFSELYKIGVPIMEFGMRRRFSKENQERIILIARNILKDKLIGTSNVMFSRKHSELGLAKGTTAHEVTMLMAVLFTPAAANYQAVKKWKECYGEQLNIALPDTLTTDKFFELTHYSHINSLDGLRQDSGKPIEFTTKYYNFCKQHNILTETKTITYSDSINSCAKVRSYKNMNETMFKFKPNCGIGAWFTSDIPGVIPVNWVIKLTKVKVGNIIKKWRYAVKLSDTPGKITTLSMHEAKVYQKKLGVKYETNN